MQRKINTITIKPSRSTVKRKIMINIYFDDGVQPSTCVRTCRTIEEAKEWISEQLKGYTMVDDIHPCSDDVIASPRTAKYRVFDGEPFVDGGPYVGNLIYESDYFYTEHYAFE